MAFNIPVGVSDFAKIRENGYYYIDKSGLIQELLKTNATEVTLITRPRRFGKTLAMSMLNCFFDIRKDSRILFEGLAVSKEEELCSRWMNQYPVLSVSFKDVGGLNYENAYGMLCSLFSQLYEEHMYLLGSSVISDYNKETFDRVARKTASLAEIKNSISLLMKMMHQYYGKQVVLLFDEYDVPLAKASSYGYYEQMLEVISAIMSTALKDNSSLRFAVITGCLRISKESIFTGTNNFTTDTISDSRYNEFFGFTHEEVRKILGDNGCREQLENVQKWYDGYRFGNLDIYCPWDVLNYVKKVTTEGVEKPENFWEYTSDNAVIGLFLERTDFDMTEKFETLLSGGCIKETITENLTYQLLTSSEENLWSLLYLTGYLTKAKKEEWDGVERLEGRQVLLKIPNAEIMDIFQKCVVEWFNKKAVRSDRRELFHELWNGGEEKLTELLSDLLFDTISFHDYGESFYHAFVTGLLSSAGYIVESNYENGLGRSDIVVKDRQKRRAIVIEAKIADSSRDLEKECASALRQIAEKQYARKIERSGFKAVICYGIAFYRKECLVRTGDGSLS